MAEDEEDVSIGRISELYKPPALLPIAQLKDQLLYAIETHPVTIVVGETGSGKLFTSYIHKTSTDSVPSLSRQNNTDPKILIPGRVVQQRPTNSRDATQKNSRDQRRGEGRRRTQYTTRPASRLLDPVRRCHECEYASEVRHRWPVVARDACGPAA